jgi:quercetin dioxygenase-like cupin family protein
MTSQRSLQGEEQMSKQAVVVKSGESEKLDVLGAEVRFLCQADKTDKAWSLMECVVPKEAGPPAHDHPWDEAYYVLEGEVQFTVGNRNVLVRRGDFIYAPGGTLHAFQGASDHPARMLIFDAPAAAEGFFRDTEREVKVFPGDLAKLPEIGARHRLRFIQ